MSDLIQKPCNSIKPIISKVESKCLVEKLYGFKCTNISELNGYDDKNYKIIVDGDSENVKNKNVPKMCTDGYILKITNSQDSKLISSADAQNSLMLYLASRNINCPRPVKNIDGKYYSIETLSSGDHMIRLLEYIPGIILADCFISTKLLVEVGKFVANFDLELQKFNHTAYDSFLPFWALDNVPKVSKFLFATKDPIHRKVVSEVISEFEKRVLPVKLNFKAGIIHGDINDQNIIVHRVDNDWIINGILDFGDSHRSCYLFELSIAIAYMIILTKDLSAGGYVLGGYSTICNLTEEETSLLKVCVAARMSQSLVMGAYTYLQDPENKYILTTATTGWQLLLELWNEPEEKLIQNWKLTPKTCT